MRNRIAMMAVATALSALGVGCSHDQPSSADQMNGTPPTNGTSNLNPTIGAKEPGDPGNHYHPMTDDTNQYRPANSGPMSTTQK